MKFLNLGCGDRYLENCVNLDFISRSEHVIRHNLLSGIPYEDFEFDVVYHSHLLEHLDQRDARTFLIDCHRVLKKGGIIRIAVPDLEGIVREYLKNLELALKGESMYQQRYDWSMLELLDQFSRTNRGGNMMEYWQQDSIEIEDYLKERVGGEFIKFRKNFHQKPSSSVTFNPSLMARIKQSVKLKLLQIITKDENIDEKMSIGDFMLGGENHKWMYDVYSLGKLLVEIGFCDIKKLDGHESNIENWDQYSYLDIEEGSVRKPDSLFMEARKNDV